MARRIVDPKTGFIQFVATPEELQIKQVLKENAELKKENSNLKKSLSDISERLDKAGL